MRTLRIKLRARDDSPHWKRIMKAVPFSLLPAHADQQLSAARLTPPYRPSAAALAGVALLSLAAGAALAADDAGEVNIYSQRQPFLIDPMFARFTEKTGIEVNTVFAKDGLTERLVNEGDNSPADLLLTADIGRLDAAVEAGVTQAVDSDVLEQSIPEEFRDPDGHWFGLTNRARVILTSKDRVEDGLVTTYEDLARPELEGRVCTRSGKHEYMVALIASMIAHHGREDAEAWLTGLKNNLARKPQGNDRAQAKGIHEGQCDVAVMNSYYLGAIADDPAQAPWLSAFDIVFPNQTAPNDRGTHMNISGISLTAAAPHRDNAIRLMEFLASDEAQSLYAELNHEYPVNPDVAASELVSSWGSFKADPLPLAEVAALRADASRLVDEVGYDY